MNPLLGSGGIHPGRGFSFAQAFAVSGADVAFAAGQRGAPASLKHLGYIGYKGDLCAVIDFALSVITAHDEVASYGLFIAG